MPGGGEWFFHRTVDHTVTVSECEYACGALVTVTSDAESGDEMLANFQGGASFDFDITFQAFEVPDGFYGSDVEDAEVDRKNMNWTPMEFNAPFEPSPLDKFICYGWAVFTFGSYIMFAIMR